MKIQFYFDSMKSANQAVQKLKNSGIQKAYVDINDHYDDDRNVDTNITGTETSISLSALVLESDAHGINRDKAPLSAANPMVSGFGKYEEIADVACSVFVDAEGADLEKAKQIVKEFGGTADNPNITKPKPKNDGQISAFSAAEEVRED